ncbi:MAG: bifunctional precorrin-2 dehydrogenase/sirohydrochlorin ferrochelatase [Lachnospiraceae bacterium]|nr:bifunctional precorrin-2 dehydrogenase/sirohydrochlorin ferrochelatase [Lachnospiraceae bacterium]
MKSSNSYFPCFISMEKQEILVIGAGQIATRRIGTLLGFVDRVYIASREFTSRIQNWQKEGRVICLGNNFDVSMLRGKTMVLACTDNRSLNHDIVCACREQNIMVNNCSSHEECDFFFPSVIQRDEIVIGISGDGSSHAKVKKVREAIEENLNKTEE